MNSSSVFSLPFASFGIKTSAMSKSIITRYRSEPQFLSMHLNGQVFHRISGFCGCGRGEKTPPHDYFRVLSMEDLLFYFSVSGHEHAG